MAATIASFSDESAVDYRNSIKESISAVEAAVKLITGESSGGIDKAIAILERSGNLHSALKAGLSKLYAYSSDTGVFGKFERPRFQRRRVMLYTIAVILLILWLLGFVSGYTIGAFIHVLLVVAIVLFLVGLLSGRRVV